MRFANIHFTLILYLFILSTPLIAQSPLSLKPDINQWSLSELVEVFPDTSGSLNFDEIISTSSESFLPITKISNLQYMDVNHIWIRFVLLNQSDHQDFILTVDNWDEAKLYVYDSLGNLHIKKTGFSYPLSERDENMGRFLHLSLSLNQDKAAIIYLKLSQSTQETIEKNKSYNFYKRFELKTRSSAEETLLGRNLFYSFSAGILFIIIIYKLVIFIYIRDTTYLYFTIFLTCLLIALCVESGFIEYYYYPNQPNKANQIYYSFLSVSYMVLLPFASSYLRLGEFFPKLAFYFRSLTDHFGTGICTFCI